MSWTGHRAEIVRAAFSRDGTWLVTASFDRTARIWTWDGAAAREHVSLGGHTGALSAADFSPDGQWLLTASDDQTAQIHAMSVCNGCGSLQDLLALAAQRVTRELTPPERELYLGEPRTR